MGEFLTNNSYTETSTFQNCLVKGTANAQAIDKVVQAFAYYDDPSYWRYLLDMLVHLVQTVGNTCLNSFVSRHWFIDINL